MLWLILSLFIGSTTLVAQITSLNIGGTGYGFQSRQTIGQLNEVSLNRWADRKAINDYQTPRFFRETGRDYQSVYLESETTPTMTYRLDVLKRELVQDWNTPNAKVIGRLFEWTRGLKTDPALIETIVPNFRPEPIDPADMAKIVDWIAKVTAARSQPYCYRQSYGRAGQQENLSSCPDGKRPEENNTLCYSACNNGFSGNAQLCWQNCPSGFRNDPFTCFKPNDYGNGGGFVDNRVCDRNAEGRGCDRYGALWYPRCKNGFRPFGPNVCTPICPNGMWDGGAFCSKQNYSRGVGVSLQCRQGLQQEGALCYQPCRSGFHSVGVVCWQNCTTSHPFECLSGCAIDQGACASSISNMIIAPIQLALNIITLGGSPEVTTAEKTLQNSVKAAKQLSLVDKIKAVPNIAKDKAALYKAYFSALPDLAGPATKAKLLEKLGESVATTVVAEFVDSMFKLARGNEFSVDDLRGLAGVDPFGFAALAEAFAQPVCSNNIPFPTLSRTYGR